MSNRRTAEVPTNVMSAETDPEGDSTPNTFTQSARHLLLNRTALRRLQERERRSARMEPIKGYPGV